MYVTLWCKNVNKLQSLFYSNVLHMYYAGCSVSCIQGVVRSAIPGQQSARPSMLIYTNVYGLMLVCDLQHYRIRALDDGGGYYIARRCIYESMMGLIEHYMGQADGLACQLVRPCYRAELPQTGGLSATVGDQWEIPRDSVHKVEFILHVGMHSFDQ